MAQRMALEDQILKLVIDQFGGGVVVTLDFIADDLHLLVYLMLGIQAVEDNVCQQIHRLHEMILRNGGIEHGILLVGKRV